MRLAAGCFGRLNMTGGGGTPTPKTKIYSGRTYKRYMQLRRRNTSRNGGDRTEAELDDKYERLRHVVA